MLKTYTYVPSECGTSLESLLKSTKGAPASLDIVFAWASQAQYDTSIAFTLVVFMESACSDTMNGEDR